MRGAGGPVTLNIQSFSEKNKHPFTRLNENQPSFRVKTGSLSQARALRVRRLSTRSEPKTAHLNEPCRRE